jgi:hypothetical protein
MIMVSALESVETLNAGSLFRQAHRSPGRSRDAAFVSLPEVVLRRMMN